MFFWNSLVYCIIKFSSLQSLSRVRLFVTPWTAARQDSLFITNSWSLLKLMSIVGGDSQPSYPVVPFSSCPQSFPVSGSFQMSQFFASGSRSIGVSASASVLPVNIQDWFPIWRRKWQPTPVLLAGKSHGRRSLVGYSPRGRRVWHDWATKLSFPLRWTGWISLQSKGISRVFSNIIVQKLQIFGA